MDDREVGDVEREGEKGPSDKDLSMIENGAQRRWRRGAAADEEVKDVDWEGETRGFKQWGIVAGSQKKADGEEQQQAAQTSGM